MKIDNWLLACRGSLLLQVALEYQLLINTASYPKSLLYFSMYLLRGMQDDLIQ